MVSSGYMSVELFNELGSKRLLIHRLVANAFIPNPNNYSQVNHKDENKANNDVSNLEWCTPKYNMNYGNSAKTRSSKIDYTKLHERLKHQYGKNNPIAKAVSQFDKEMNFIIRFDCIADAERELKIKRSQSHIVDCCKLRRLTSNGYVWRYEKEE
jgi:hypothetical protein